MRQSTAYSARGSLSWIIRQCFVNFALAFRRSFNPSARLRLPWYAALVFASCGLVERRCSKQNSFTAEINPPVTKTTYPPRDPNATWIFDMVDRSRGTTVVLDLGLPERLSAPDVETFLTFQRYETAIENKLYRALNQLERLQRMRRGDKISAPAAVDVNVHHESERRFVWKFRPLKPVASASQRRGMVIQK